MVGLDKNQHMWIIANWKSHKTISEALEWINFVGPKLQNYPNVTAVVCPTFLAIPDARRVIDLYQYPLLIGAQDVSPFDIGADTGEIPARLLKGLVDIVIIGHSERRNNFSESNEMIIEKVKQVKQEGITPLLCIQGEETPLPEGVEMVAYEPIFAIGTGQADTPEDARKVAKFLQKKQSSLKVIYGGSVTAENVVSFTSIEEITGVLVGGASLKGEEFMNIIKSVG